VVAFALLGVVGAGAPAGAQDGGYAPERYPPPPASFDPSRIVMRDVVGDPMGWGYAWTTAIDGSDARLAAPARADAMMITPDLWIQPPAPTCVEPGPSAFGIVRPGQGPIRQLDDVVGHFVVRDGAAWVARARIANGRERGLGIWRLPADGGAPTRVWNLQATRVYGWTYPSEAGRRLAVMRGFDPYHEMVPPRPRVRIEGRSVATLPRDAALVGWDARGGLILTAPSPRGDPDRRSRRVARWDPVTQAIRPIDRPRDGDDVAVLPGGRTIVVEGRDHGGRSSIGLIDVRTWTRRDLTLPSDWWTISDTSTARYVVLDAFIGPFPDRDPRQIKAVIDVREAWVGYLVVKPLAEPLLPTVTTVAADGTPRPPAWFDPTILRYAGSATGDPADLGDGLWVGGIDGRGLVKVAPAAIKAVSLIDGTVAWTERSGGGAGPGRLRLLARSPDGDRRVLARDLLDGEIVADPDGTAVWAWRADRSHGRAWWRIPTDGAPPTVERKVPADALDIRMDAGAGSIAYGRQQPGGTTASYLLRRNTERSRSVTVERSPAPVVAFSCGGMPITRAERGLEVVDEDEEGVPWMISTWVDAEIPAVQTRDLITSVSPVAGPGRAQSVHVANRWSWGDPGRDIPLTAGDWQLTALGTDRYLVLRDATRSRFGVLDLVELWFAEVPFVPRIADAGAQRG